MRKIQDFPDLPGCISLYRGQYYHCPFVRRQFRKRLGQGHTVTAVCRFLRYIVRSFDEIIQADLLFEEADYDDCDMIVLPGGMPGALHLKNHEELGEKITEFALQGKALAAICAAPMVLDARGALTHKTATIYPGMQNELNMASYIDSGVVEDGNVITGKGPAYAIGFALAIIRKIKGDNAADEVAEGLLYKGIL